VDCTLVIDTLYYDYRFFNTPVFIALYIDMLLLLAHVFVFCVMYYVQCVVKHTFVELHV
jgi:hypothetical protein